MMKDMKEAVGFGRVGGERRERENRGSNKAERKWEGRHKDGLRERWRLGC